MIEILAIGVLTAFFTMLLNYCMGKPGSEKFSPYEIFSSYTVWLSKMRLKTWKVDLYKTYAEQYNENLRRLTKSHERITLENDFKKMLYEAAEPFFTWERAVGMCSVCFGFWVSLLSGLVFTQKVVDLLIIVVISHVTIRLLNKII